MKLPKFHCLLCQARESEILSSRDSKSGEALEVRICLGCGLGQQSPLPDDASLGVYYSHHYRQDYKKAYTPQPKHIYRAAVAASRRLDFLFETLSRQSVDPAPATLLDIGAGGGEFICVARKFGFDAKGIEPNVGYSEFARNAYGVQVDTEHLNRAVGRRADVVTLFHVLEHLSDPVSTMENLYQIVNVGGWLFIEVPNIEQADASPANIYFRAHLFYFSEATLISAASSCFEPVSIDSKGNLRILFRRRDSPLPPRLPQTEQVRQTLERLTKKGWMEYLTKGGGLLKPARRIRQYWIESQLKGLAPCEIVERALADSRLA